MSDLPIITVTSIHDGFANAESVPEIEPYDDGCDGEGCAACRPTEGPCPFDTVLWVPEHPEHLEWTQRFGKKQVTVTGLHHADECIIPAGSGIEFRCHPDALPGQWHLHFKETE